MTSRMGDGVRIVGGVGDLIDAYQVVLCDVWGVLHDGRSAYPPAGDALARFRASGGFVVLLSNAPMPQEPVRRLLEARGVRADAYDDIVTSGDITRMLVAERRLQRVHHIGPPRDLSLFEDLPAERTGLAEAQAVIATGLVEDQRETAESYRGVLEEALTRRLSLICANPDLVVEVAGRLLPCAGVLAELYEQLGGDVTWAGKPWPVAYRAALATAERLIGGKVPASRMLAIGDALRTDVLGAQRFGIDVLFVAGGIHRGEIMPHGRIDPTRLDAALAGAGATPVATIPALAW